MNVETLPATDAEVAKMLLYWIVLSCLETDALSLGELTEAIRLRINHHRLVTKVLAEQGLDGHEPEWRAHTQEMVTRAFICMKTVGGGPRHFLTKGGEKFQAELLTGIFELNAPLGAALNTLV